MSARARASDTPGLRRPIAGYAYEKRAVFIWSGMTSGTQSRDCSDGNANALGITPITVRFRPLSSICFPMIGTVAAVVCLPERVAEHDDCVVSSCLILRREQPTNDRLDAQRAERLRGQRAANDALRLAGSGEVEPDGDCRQRGATAPDSAI